jgi:hypothetical protein
MQIHRTLTLLLCATAAAQSITYVVPLNGREVVPPVVAGSSGGATIVVDVRSGAVSINGTFGQVGSAVTAVALHGSAQRGRTATPILACTPTTGTVGTFAGTGILGAAQLRDLVEGLTYIELATVVRPAGEMRGQVDVVPGSGPRQGSAHVRIEGAAVPGGVLVAAAQSAFVLLGVALAPGQVIPIGPPLTCPVYPGGWAIDPAFPIAVSLGGMTVPIPVGLPPSAVTFQSVFSGVTSCAIIQAARRIAIRP